MAKTWVQDNGKYYLEDNGIKLKGFQMDANDKLYFLDENGAMQTGWIHNGSNLYYASICNTVIDNTQYYMGELFTNTTAKVDSSGTYKFDYKGVATKQ